MVHTPGKRSQIPVNIVMLLTIFLIVGFVVVAGCSIPSINTKDGNSSSPTITPSITAQTPAVVQTTVPGRTGTTPPPVHCFPPNLTVKQDLDLSRAAFVRTEPD